VNFYPQYSFPEELSTGASGFERSDATATSLAWQTGAFFRNFGTHIEAQHSEAM